MGIDVLTRLAQPGASEAAAVARMLATARPNDLVTEVLPAGLPFLGEELPLCARPTSGAIFERAGAYGGDAVRHAKGICLACPYLTPCADWALSNDETWGVWGGMSVRERGMRRRAMLRGVPNA